MNEQEKEFMAFVEWLPKNIEKFANVKPEDIISYLEELGKTPEGQNELKSLVTKYKQSKNTVTLNKKGGKVEAFIKKFYVGGTTQTPEVKTNEKWRYTPWPLSFAVSRYTTLPKVQGLRGPRSFKRVVDPSTGEQRDRMINPNTGEYIERVIYPFSNGKIDTTYYNIYNEAVLPSEDEGQKYELRWKSAGVYRNGGKLNLDLFKNKK